MPQTERNFFFSSPLPQSFKFEKGTKQQRYDPNTLYVSPLFDFQVWKAKIFEEPKGMIPLPLPFSSQCLFSELESGDV